MEILKACFTETEKTNKRTILIFIWNHRRVQIAKTILKEEQRQRYHTLWFQNILQSYSNKLVQYWHKGRHMDKGSTIE